MTEAKKEISEVKAFARGVHISPRKARLVVNLVKNLPVHDALLQLEFVTKKGAKPLMKLLASAVANAKHNFQIDENKLFVKSFTVDGGRVFFRYTPRAQGRAFPVRKRTSHLNLILGVSKIAFRSEKALPRKPSVEKEKEKLAETARPLQKTQEEKKSRFAFWRRKKKAEDTSQISPKEDPKGRHYTGFDRKGNMP